MEAINEIVRARILTGSRVICDPPPTDTDEDHLLLVHGEFDDIHARLSSLGFIKDGSENYDSGKELEEGGFLSYKLGNLNYIIVTSFDTFHRYELATQLAKELNLHKKEDRIKVFQWFLHKAGLC